MEHMAAIAGPAILEWQRLVSSRMDFTPAWCLNQWQVMQTLRLRLEIRPS
jgi:hypothetical protein